MGQKATNKRTDSPTHHAGTRKGEEIKESHGTKPGRHHKDAAGAGRPSGGVTARHSTGINLEDREPIGPRMPHMPPA